MDSTELRSVETRYLINAYLFSGNEKAKQELKRREAIPSHEWELVDKGTVRIGMTKWGMVLAMGEHIFKCNKSVGLWGVHRQFIYHGDTYIYTENGYVTSWQVNR
jgi:hypothetical protein